MSTRRSDPQGLQLVLAGLCFVGLWSFDLSHQRDLTSTLLFGVLIWWVASHFGRRPGVMLAIFVSLLHGLGNYFYDQQQHTAEVILEEVSECLIFVLMAVQSDRLSQSQAGSLKMLEDLSRQLESARRVQMALQGPQPERVEGARLASRSLVAQALGDDFLLICEDSSGTTLGVADVSGKGPQAALVAAVARGICQEILRKPVPPAQILSRLEARLSGLLPDEMFITCWVGRFEPSRQRLVYACAGHEPALLRRGGETLELAGQDLPVGPFAPQKFEEHTVEFPPGTTLLVFSDGLSEAPTGSGNRLGAENVARWLEREGLEPKELLHHLEGLLPATLVDDVTMVALTSDQELSLWEQFQES